NFRFDLIRNLARVDSDTPVYVAASAGLIYSASCVVVPTTRLEWNGLSLYIISPHVMEHFSY
ncbi:MAG: hypothetical protein AAGB06_07105, partial [Verrucomicrobiota bacterium]